MREFIFLTSLLVACQVPSAPEEQRTEYREALDALEAARRGGVRGAEEEGELVELRGYSFHWQFDHSDGKRGLIVSRNLGGSLLLFSAEGELLARRECNEITSVQWFDLDGDGKPEWITEEIDGQGTGLLAKSYRIYRYDGRTIQSLWSGLSYDRRLEADSFQKGVLKFDVKRGFIKLEPAGAGRRTARLLHWIIGPGEREEVRRAYVWNAGRVEASDWP